MWSGGELRMSVSWGIVCWRCYMVSLFSWPSTCSSTVTKNKATVQHGFSEMNVIWLHSMGQCCTVHCTTCTQWPLCHLTAQWAKWAMCPPPPTTCAHWALCPLYNMGSMSIVPFVHGLSGHCTRWTQGVLHPTYSMGSESIEPSVQHGLSGCCTTHSGSAAPSIQHGLN